MKCIYEFERSVNQVLWYSVFEDWFDNGNFENDTFEIKNYDWNDDDNNEYHFWHKPSGFKLQWYKYPIRSPRVNMEITHEQFLAILRDCYNSLNRICSFAIEKWWDSDTESEV